MPGGSRLMPTCTRMFMIAIGSMVGGVLRWEIATLSPVSINTGIVWSTLFVNVVGSCAIGLAAGRFRSSDSSARHFVMTGFCGGFTTFSLFSLESLLFLMRGQPGLAAANIMLSLLLCLVAVWLGFRIGQGLTAGAGDARS